jgi:hypothetical protein
MIWNNRIGTKLCRNVCGVLHKSHYFVLIWQNNMTKNMGISNYKLLEPKQCMNNQVSNSSLNCSWLNKCWWIIKMEVGCYFSVWYHYSLLTNYFLVKAIIIMWYNYILFVFKKCLMYIFLFIVDIEAGYRSEPDNSSKLKSRTKSLSDFKADFKSSSKPKSL